MVGARSTAGAEHGRRGQAIGELQARPDRHAFDVRCSADNDDRGAVEIETGHGGLVGPDEPPDLFADRREELGRRGSLRDERGDPPQRRLLVGKPCERAP
jgi:hypothetical protein